MPFSMGIRMASITTIIIIGIIMLNMRPVHSLAVAVTPLSIGVMMANIIIIIIMGIIIENIPVHWSV